MRMYECECNAEGYSIVSEKVAGVYGCVLLTGSIALDSLISDTFDSASWVEYA